MWNGVMAFRKCKKPIVVISIGFCVSLFFVVNPLSPSVRSSDIIVIKEAPVVKKDKPQTKHEIGKRASGSSDNSMVHCYPMALPNLRELVKNVLEEKEINISSINNHYVHMKFDSTSAKPCSAEDSVDILLLVKSAPKNNRNRAVLRTMWLNQTYLSNVSATVKYAFLIGTKQFPSVPSYLLKEARGHNDLIFMDYVDTYRNNTYKTMGAMKWTLENCRNARYIALVDDDLFVNVKNLARFLRNPSKYPKEKSEHSSYDAGSIKELFAGKARPARNFRPHRNPKITWYVSWEEYPCKEFPVFFPGMTTIFSYYTLREFYTASRFVKHLSIDDVYLGVIASKLGVRRTNLGGNIVDYPYRKDCENEPKLKRDVISIHLPKNHKRRLEFWNKCIT